MFHVFSVRVLAVSVMAGSALALAAACGGDDGGAKPSPTIPFKTDGDATKAPDGNGGGGGGETIEILLKDNFFEPKDFNVPVGVEVTIDTKNVGQAIHNMHVLSQAKEGKDFTSDAMVNPGKESKFKVKFSKTGVYDYQCDYHVPDMVGKITVS